MFHSYLSIKGHFFVISKLNKNTSNLTIQWFRVCAPRPLGESWDATPGSYCQRLLTFEGTENCSFRSCTSSNLSFVSEHPQKPWVFSVVLYVGHLYLRQGMVLSDVTVAWSILPPAYTWSAFLLLQVFAQALCFLLWSSCLFYCWLIRGF